MKRKQDNSIELAVLKEVVKRNKLKNTGKRIDDMVSILMEKGITLPSSKMS